MQTARHVPFVSDRIMNRFMAITETFREAAHNSIAADTVISLLLESDSDLQYATGSRNECVERLAKDAEARMGLQADLLFRRTGALHNSLQTLMDHYMDAMDGIYYHE